MNPDEVSAKVRATLSALLNLPEACVHAESSRDTLEEWDSLKHMHLVLALEEEFGVEFDDGEVSGLATVDELTRAVNRKLAERGH